MKNLIYSKILKRDVEFYIDPETRTIEPDLYFHEDRLEKDVVYYIRDYFNNVSETLNEARYEEMGNKGYVQQP